jgi:hypothetical protein
MVIVQPSEDPAARFNAEAIAKNWPTRIDETSSFQSAKLHAMRSLWDSIVTEGRLPRRSEFTARLLKPHMANLNILGIEAEAGCPYRYRHRYVGTGVVAVLGELTGLRCEDFLPPQLVPRTVRCFDAVVAGRRPVRVLTRFLHERANYLTAEAFVAPLAEDGTTPNMVMTVTAFAQPGSLAAPLWEPEDGLAGYQRVS